MTREEAIHELSTIFGYGFYNERVDEALNMAIDALEQEPIIYCKDCKYCDINITISKSVTGEVIDVNECIRFHKYVDEDDYCSFAERKAQ